VATESTVCLNRGTHLWHGQGDQEPLPWGGLEVRTRCSRCGLSQIETYGRRGQLISTMIDPGVDGMARPALRKPANVPPRRHVSADPAETRRRGILWPNGDPIAPRLKTPGSPSPRLPGRGRRLRGPGAVLVGVAIVFAMLRILHGSSNSDPTPTSSPGATDHDTTASVETWRYVQMTCADGWPSGSIGSRGACSHHGGVVTVYEGSRGTSLRCGDGTHPPRDADQQARQLREHGRLFCTSLRF
jgi:hypothetical protein